MVLLATDFNAACTPLLHVDAVSAVLGTAVTTGLVETGLLAKASAVLVTVSAPAGTALVSTLFANAPAVPDTRTHAIRAIILFFM